MAKRLTPSISSSKIRFHVHGVPISLDKEVITRRSSVLASLVKQKPHNDYFDELRNIPFDPEMFELVARFCHGYELNLSSENVVPLCCVASYLGMDETHSPNNLLKKCRTYFRLKILPSWNESVKALRSTESVIQHAIELGLISDCFDSLIHKALENPRLLSYEEDMIEEEEDDQYKPNVKRKLFQIESNSEDLTSLSLQLYEPLIRKMTESQVKSRYIASSLVLYAKKNSSQKRVIEAVETLLPNEIGLLPCIQLFELLKIAISTEANFNCRNGFETRVGKQLDEATAQDLLIPFRGYSKEGNYDTECVKRLLRIFYNNIAAATSNSSGLLYTVAELIEDFLSGIAGDVNLTVSTFNSLAEMASSVSTGLDRSSDELYRAIDIYLNHHKHLTESEREEICQVLDCHKLSPMVCQHAAQNSRLPLRIVVQVLFVGQLHLRDVIKKEVCDPSVEGEEIPLIDNHGRDKASRASTLSSNTNCSSKEEVMMEMEKMGSKVRELEREYNTMKKVIEDSKCVKKEKVSVWKEMKRKIGCIGSIHDCVSHVQRKTKKKKVHPRNSNSE